MGVPDSFPVFKMIGAPAGDRVNHAVARLPVPAEGLFRHGDGGFRAAIAVGKAAGGDAGVFAGIIGEYLHRRPHSGGGPACIGQLVAIHPVAVVRKVIYIAGHLNR